MSRALRFCAQSRRMVALACACCHGEQFDIDCHYPPAPIWEALTRLIGGDVNPLLPRSVPAASRSRSVFWVQTLRQKTDNL